MGRLPADAICFFEVSSLLLVSRAIACGFVSWRIGDREIKREPISEKSAYSRNRPTLEIGLLAKSVLRKVNPMKILVLCLVCLLTSLCRADEQVGPWNLTQLKQATPAVQWVDQSGPVHSLLYSGEKYQDQDTEVFAFYASPRTLGKTINADEKFPGVVLIHGGGGTAFVEWTWLWAQRGYAAIAMDLSGSRPIAPIYDEKTGAPVPGQAAKPDTRTRLARGGPNHGHGEKFDTIGGDHQDDWPYHAVASVMRAHSVLRGLKDVDGNRTAVTGISWGGYTTCLVASLDDRFKAAVPVYGCGYLFEGESVQKPAIDKLGERRQQWIDTYDPSAVLTRCRVPILFVNGTNDIHYPLDSYQKSFDCVPGFKQMRIEIEMRHGHPPGWAPAEIGLFIDAYCKQGTALPSIGKLAINKELGTVRVEVKSPVQLKSANLCYTSDTGARSSRKWQTLPVRSKPGRRAITWSKHLGHPKPPTPGSSTSPMTATPWSARASNLRLSNSGQIGLLQLRDRSPDRFDGQCQATMIAGSCNADADKFALQVE